MRVHENELIQRLKRWCERPGIADALKPSFLIELIVGHLTHPGRLGRHMSLFGSASHKSRYEPQRLELSEARCFAQE
jgi:hypothetical protein